MLITRFLFLLFIPLLVSCKSMSENTYGPIKVQVDGDAIFEREVTVRNYVVTGASIPSVPGSCINGIFADPESADAQAAIGKNIKVSIDGYLFDYIDYFRSDPLMATVSRLQNSCGNEHFIIISRVREK